MPPHCTYGPFWCVVSRRWRRPTDTHAELPSSSCRELTDAVPSLDRPLLASCPTMPEGRPTGYRGTAGRLNTEMVASSCVGSCLEEGRANFGSCGVAASVRTPRPAPVPQSPPGGFSGAHSIIVALAAATADFDHAPLIRRCPWNSSRGYVQSAPQFGRTDGQ